MLNSVKCLLFGAAICSPLGSKLNAQIAEGVGQLQDKRCFLGSLSFTEGSTARASGEVMTCDADGNWVTQLGDASVCIRDGKAFGVGSVESVSSNAGLTIKCLPNGAWEERGSNSKP